LRFLLYDAGRGGLETEGMLSYRKLAAVIVGLFMVVGLFAAGQADRLVDPDTALDTAGLWVQMVAIVGAVAAGVLALRRPPSTRRA